MRSTRSSGAEATDPRLVAEVASQPFRFVFVTIVGEHLYGCAAKDSGYDLRGCHVLPAPAVLGLRAPEETLAYTAHRDGLDLEMLSNDLGRLALMLLKKNGNTLEHVFSPLVVLTTPDHEELKEAARACASRNMANHFASHAAMQRALLEESGSVKAVLLALRVLLTGTHLMRTGETEASLDRLGEHFRLPYLRDLVARRIEGGPGGRLKPEERDFFVAEYERLRGGLEEAMRESSLPPLPGDAARDRLDALLVRLRLEGFARR
jgi:predicted nucleotidyltransferase